ncbi:MAG: dihydroneopterin aldolase family protein [Pseudomonadota bacterium]|jgi:dihydroneopterin aldolase
MTSSPTVQPLRSPPDIGPGPEGIRRVFIRDLVAACELGIHSHEKGSRQRVRVNLELGVRDDGPPAGDSIHEVLCYEDVADGLRKLLAGPHVNLVETLAETIARFCFEDPRVLSARVRVEKLDVFSDAAGAGVEIERVRRRS